MNTLPKSLLSEQEIVSTWQGMPGGPDGWLTNFGFLQFARAIESAAIKAYAAKLAQGVELEVVGRLDVSKYRGHLENYSFDLTADDLDGSYPLVPLSTAQAAVAAERLKTEKARALHKQACEAYDRKNRSGCCCTISDGGEGDEVVKPCAMHQAWREEAVAAERVKTAEAEAKLDAFAKESIERAAREYAKHHSPAPAAEPAPTGLASHLRLIWKECHRLKSTTDGRKHAEAHALADWVMGVVETLQRATPSPLPAAAGANWEGCEGWEPLAWELCAEEHGEEACSELIWEGGPVPEPWGDRWLKYESEAKRLIALVQQHARLASTAAQVAEVCADRAAHDAWLKDEKRHHREVELSSAFDAGREAERKGVHAVAGGFDEPPFQDCPEEWMAADVFCRIEYFSDDGDPSVGMPGRCGWQLAADQSGTMLAKLAADAAEDAKLLQLQGGSGQ